MAASDFAHRRGSRNCRPEVVLDGNSGHVQGRVPRVQGPVPGRRKARAGVGPEDAVSEVRHVVPGGSAGRRASHGTEPSARRFARRAWSAGSGTARAKSGGAHDGRRCAFRSRYWSAAANGCSGTRSDARGPYRSSAAPADVRNTQAAAPAPCTRRARRRSVRRGRLAGGEHRRRRRSARAGSSEAASAARSASGAAERSRFACRSDACGPESSRRAGDESSAAAETRCPSGSSRGARSARAGHPACASDRRQWSRAGGRSPCGSSGRATPDCTCPARPRPRLAVAHRLPFRAEPRARADRFEPRAVARHRPAGEGARPRVGSSRRWRES